MQCRLCESDGCHQYYTDTARDYFSCDACKLIFVSQKDFISPEEEKERYSFHNNTLDNSTYVAYLTSVAQEIKRIPIYQPKVLDFGSGQHNVLTHILRQQGIDCTAYDPMYEVSIDPGTLFDVCILCEVIEHIRDMKRVTALLRNVLKSKGYVFIKTELFHEKNDFCAWWYIHDRTHINFFTEPAIQKFGQLLGKSIFYSNNKNVVIFG